MQKENNNYIIILNIFLFSFISTLFSKNFTPQNNQKLNYRQIEFSWPQIPNSNNYKLDIKKSNNILYSFNTTNNIIIVDGYDLDWGEEYSWQICGFYDADLYECHDKKYFELSELPEDRMPTVLEVQYLDESKIMEGLTIFTGYHHSKTSGIGIDKYGEILWFSGEPRRDIRFLDNGNIIARTSGRLTEYTINDELVFESENLGFHHLVQKTINNTFLGLINSNKSGDCPSECQPPWSLMPITWKGDSIIELDINGNIIWEWDTHDYIGIHNYNSHYVENIGVNSGGIIDWTHSNEVFYNQNENAMYLSLRNINTITKIDYDTKEIIWHLGDLDTLNSSTFNSYFNEHPTFNHQHTPELTSNNTLMLFNNGTYNNPKVSSCQEYSISNNNSFQLIWEYILNDTLYTDARGECHRLDNQNILIACGRLGNFLEIDDNNNLVWHVAHASSTGTNTTYRITKINNLYPSSFNILFDNYKGWIDIEGIEIGEDNILSLNIINNGWLDDQYTIEIIDYNKTINISNNSSKKIEIPLEEIFINESVNLTNSKFSDNININIYSKNQNKTTLYSNIFITKGQILPREFSIAKTYPNPFNPIMNLEIDIPEASNIIISIFNIQGRKVDEIYNGYVPIGRHTFNWDAEYFSSGLYFLRLQSNFFNQTKKITLIK